MTSKVRRLVDWNSHDLDQRLLQVAERIAILEEKYERVEMVCVVVGYGEDGTYYEPSFTPMRPADLLWAAEVIRKKALEHGEDV